MNLLNKRNEVVEKLVRLADFLDRDNHKEEADRLDNIIKDAFNNPQLFDESFAILNKNGFIDNLIMKYNL